MSLETRKLTGRPSWPISALVGGEKVGKTWAAVLASSSDLVGRCLWFPLGEDDPDEYSLIPGFDHAKFDLVQHDGTYRGLLAAMREAHKEPAKDGKPTLWVLDSGSRLWDLLSGMAQLDANQRREAKARKFKTAVPDDEEARIDSDLWNIATDRWYYVLDELKAHPGPSIITARMELTTVFSADGKPTKDKAQKILAQKRLPFDVGNIVEMPARGETYLTGVRSVKLSQLAPRVEFKNFAFDTLWRRLGLDGDVGPRTHTGIDVEDKPALDADQARIELGALCDANGWNKAEIAAEWAATSDVALAKSTNAQAIRAFAAEQVTARKAKEAA
jgi:hypothetical protein